MFETTKLHEYVEKTLQLDPEENADEIRAAAYVLVALGRTYVWPVDDIDRHLALAIGKLEKIKDLFAEEDPEFVESIDEEIEKLKEHSR